MSTSKTMKTPLLRPNTERFGDDPDSVRTVEPFLQSADEKAHSFPKNVITTSRYTALNFFPKTLFEQFRRLANVYFVVIGIIAIIGQETRVYLTAIQPAGILLPVIIVILISVIKDGVEDIKRHEADKLVNTREVKVVTISGDVEVCAWRDLDVGSIVLLFCDEEIPADMVVLVAGGVQGNTTFVETAAIDGETNLKVRHPVLPDSKVTLSRDKKACIGLRDLQIKLMAELPNGSINHFDGSISCTTENSTSQSTLSEKNLMLRGSNLRASGWCVGMVVYTGAHTKLSLNSKSVPSKLSSMDRIVNKTLVIAIFGLIVVCVLSAIFQYIWISVNDGAYYLCLDQDDLNYKYSSEKVNYLLYIAEATKKEYEQVHQLKSAKLVFKL